MRSITLDDDNPTSLPCWARPATGGNNNNATDALKYYDNYE